MSQTPPRHASLACGREPRRTSRRRHRARGAVPPGRDHGLRGPESAVFRGSMAVGPWLEVARTYAGRRGRRTRRRRAGLRHHRGRTAGHRWSVSAEITLDVLRPLPTSGAVHMDGTPGARRLARRPGHRHGDRRERDRPGPDAASAGVSSRRRTAWSRRARGAGRRLPATSTGCWPSGPAYRWPPPTCWPTRATACTAASRCSCSDLVASALAPGAGHRVAAHHLHAWHPDRRRGPLACRCPPPRPVPRRGRRRRRGRRQGLHHRPGRPAPTGLNTDSSAILRRPRRG